MMKIPEPVRKGQQITADWANQIRAALLAREVTSFRGGRFQVERGGTVLEVDLRAAGAAAPQSFLQLTQTKPRYAPAPASPPASSDVRVWLSWGKIHGKVATNFTAHWDVADTGEHHFFAEVLLGDDAFALSVLSWEVKHAAAEPDFVPSGAFTATSVRPSTINVPLGSVIDGVVVPDGNGSMTLAEYGIGVRTSGGSQIATRSIYAVRDISSQ